MCVTVHVHVLVHVYVVGGGWYMLQMWVLLKATWYWIPGTDITGVCETRIGCWEPNSGSAGTVKTLKGRIYNTLPDAAAPGTSFEEWRTWCYPRSLLVQED